MASVSLSPSCRLRSLKTKSEAKPTTQNEHEKKRTQAQSIGSPSLLQRPLIYAWWEAFHLCFQPYLAVFKGNGFSSIAYMLLSKSDEANREWAPEDPKGPWYDDELEDDEEDACSPFPPFTENVGRGAPCDLIDFYPPDKRRGIPTWTAYMQRTFLDKTCGHWADGDKKNTWLCAAMYAGRLCIVSLRFFIRRLLHRHHETMHHRLVVEVDCLGFFTWMGDVPFSYIPLGAERAMFLRRQMLEMGLDFGIPHRGEHDFLGGWDAYCKRYRLPVTIGRAFYGEESGWLGLGKWDTDLSGGLSSHAWIYIGPDDEKEGVFSCSLWHYVCGNARLGRKNSLKCKEMTQDKVTDEGRMHEAFYFFFAFLTSRLSLEP